MSNPRRSLLAAGLTAAVVGSLGAAWTLNAAAEEVPAAPAVAAPADADAADQAPAVTAQRKPPALLPWGERPSRLKRARAGASSAAVTAAGADAAPADTSGSKIPVPVYAPKGFAPDEDGAAPPAPPGVTPKSDDFYHYAGGRQIGDTDGSWANLSIAKPELATADAHTLTEIALQSADSKQIVEVGWNVDRKVNGDDDPHLFVYYWKDKKKSCYNSCGFEPYSEASIKPGDTLPIGVQKRFGVKHSGGAWWIAYDSEWVGSFPDSLWGGTYTRAGLTQWFGEVAAATATTCTDMGKGLAVTDGTASRIGTISMTNGPDPVSAEKFDSTTPASYDSKILSPTTIRYGGPGTGPCPPA
ncbi:neprosin family prolyl endopeptidase [Actinoplanes sp. NPDC049548]|uniref:neprosin family prolyl endopeptidase n=1 Tax=Actinoplanes sp. NPDC049548 TaxID=3155152 RepID=UPI003430C92B